MRVGWVAGIAMIAAANWPRDRLPERTALLPVMESEPRQHAIDRPPFTTTVGGIEYTVTPLFDYEIWGLVVARYDTSVWYNFSHKRWKDELNVADLCVVFGDNVRTGAYKALTYSCGEFTCYAEADTSEAWEAFWPTDLSNNHLLTDHPDLARALRNALPGAQVRIKGRLVEYSHNSGSEFKRGTSIVRTDMGNGACETIWVEEFEVLEPGPPTLRWVGWLGAMFIVGSIVCWAVMPARVR